MKKSKSEIPKFKNEEEEFDFWSSHDSIEFFHETEEISEKLEVTKPKLRKQRITMLLDPRLKAQLQKIAEEKGVRYQTLIQMWLKEKVKQEIKSRTA
ncbi:MAG TPA: CopG family antitoxin [Thermodesulfobacteriota bacterium]|nr:CopG family antitoxin [Thermodesulfobacteriota bacterium]